MWNLGERNRERERELKIEMNTLMNRWIDYDVDQNLWGVDISALAAVTLEL